MGRFQAPASGVSQLAELDDVDLTLEDGPVNTAELVHNGSSWVGRIPLPFGGQAGGVPAGAVWASGTNFPGSTNSLNAHAAAGDSMYVLDPNATTPFTLYRYDVLDDTWTALAVMPTDTVTSNLAYVAGVLVCPGVSGTYIYHPDTDTWTTRAATTVVPDIEQGHGITLGNRAVFIVCDQAETIYVASYDPLADSWTAGDQLAQDNNRASLEVAELDGYAYLVGGQAFASGGNDEIAEVWRWSPAAQWQQRTDLPDPRANHMLAAVNGLLYALGGTDSTGTPRADMDVYNPTANAWEQLGAIHDIPADTFTGACEGIGTRIVLAAGAGPINNRATRIYG